MKQSKFSKLVAKPDSPLILRGEIWVSPVVLAEAGFDNVPSGMVGFASSLEADICFFDFREAVRCSVLMELAELAHGAGMVCGLIIDGPFQRLAGKRNILDILRGLGRDFTTFQRLLTREMEEITALLSLIEKADVDLILIGEDLGYAGGLYFSPELFRSYFLPFYEALVNRLSASGIALGWHSDGAVEPILKDLVGCGFRFFSLEPECVDLLRFKRAHGPLVTLMSGIRADWLSRKEFDRGWLEECYKEMSTLTREGGLILASTVGLYHPGALANLREIYRLIADMQPSKTRKSRGQGEARHL